MAAAHKRAGYTGMILTNHNWGGNTTVSRELSWSSFLDAFFAPYFEAKRWGDENDFQVFPGYEAGYDGTEFLIYGVDTGWMYDHPELREATVAEQFDIIHSGGGVVVHAHPFRKAFYIKEIRLFPEYIDGVEAVNATHSSPYAGEPALEYNERALEYAKKLGVFITGGSDTHSVNLLDGGMAFSEKLRDVNDFTARLLAAEPSSWRVTDGKRVYDAFGGIL
jgi:hypothetical protein